MGQAEVKPGHMGGPDGMGSRSGNGTGPPRPPPTRSAGLAPGATFLSGLCGSGPDSVLSGLDLAVDHARLLPRTDLDLLRLLGLGHLAHQLDVQEAVGEAGAGHPDVVGELEAMLEGAPADAAMQVDGVVGLRTLALDGQQV